MSPEQPTPTEETEAPLDGNVPSPERELGPWLLAGALALLGAGVLVAALLLGGGSGSSKRASAPPPVPVVAVTPTPSPAAAASVLASTGVHHRHHATRIVHKATRSVARPTARQQRLDATRLVDQTQTQIATRWMEGFYPIYAVAQRTFGVNWLLIASIHRQESAFSTAPDTYTGLNFAGCCGGPMQFNVTNGPVPTWRLVSDSFRYGRRPSSYDHETTKHPSIYDDFDSIMAAAHLLSADGASYSLDAGAWSAAYSYYGHDATGVTYADQVVARAIGWSQQGFCANCGVDTALVEAVHVTYGAPVLAALVKASAAAVRR